jgi:heptosyltransferase-2
MDVRRIGVVAPSWLGDVVMALPALADVVRRFAGAEVLVAARRNLAPLFEAVPGLAGVIPLEGRGRSGRRADVSALRAARLDATLLLPNSFHAAWVTWRAGIGERWGYRSDARSLLLTRGIRRPRTARTHHARYYQHLTAQLGCTPGPLEPALRLTPALHDAGEIVLRRAGWEGERIVGLAPGAANGSAKRWPPDRMGQIAARLSLDHGIRPVLVGAPDDQDTARDVVAHAERAGIATGGTLNLVGRTTLRALMGVMARCAAFVSNDSGAMHLAAALDVPVVAIFGPTREWATSPLPGPAGRPAIVVHADVFCRPCMLPSCPIDHRCMTRIGSDEILARLREAIEGSATT